MWITITAISERQRARSNTHKKRENCKTFLYTKSQTLCKNQDNLRYNFIHKNPDNLLYAIFMKFLKLAYTYKHNYTFIFVTMLYTKNQTLSKKQDNFCNIFFTKILTICIPLFFINILYCPVDLDSSLSVVNSLTAF